MGKARPSTDRITPPAWSPLYCRFNGFMLGCFQGLIRYRFARTLFDQHLARSCDFLDEAAIAIALPDDRLAHVGRRIEVRSPDDGHTILPEYAISRDDREVVHEGLCDEHAIERIAMMERQVHDSGHMPEFHTGQHNAVARQLLRNEPFEALGESEFPETELDGELPAARDAEEHLVVRVGDLGPRSATQRRRSFDPPEKRMRVEQQLHRV